MVKKAFFTCLSLVFCSSLFAQLSGDLQLNSQFFRRDSSIGAYNTPLYDNLFSGVDAWLNVNYSIKGFTAGVRLDVFENSNLHDPKKAYSNQGLGFFYIQKDIEKLNITGGYFYEQFGSGVAFRAYEDRGLGIDYALAGIRLRYQLNDNWQIKAIAGRQKNLFDLYKPVVKGTNIEGRVKISDHINLLPGASIVNRTIDYSTMDLVAATISSYPDSLHFIPKYNVCVYSLYNSINFFDFTATTEFAFKSHEAILGSSGKLEDHDGNYEYASLAYNNAAARLGITIQGKRTGNFIFRTSPNESLLQGVLDFIPPIARQNSMRLLARYSPATQYIGELGFEGDLVWTPKKGYPISLNYSDIKDLDNVQLYREIYGDIEINKSKKIKLHLGLQSVFYNFGIYRAELTQPSVMALTPFGEITWKINKKKSLRLELQYQSTKQDYGSWTYSLLEFNIAPKWSFAASDMYNITPNPDNASATGNHYPTLFAAFTKGGNRFTIAYVKQVDGVNCTGGVCRYEPAFSGIKFTVTSSF